MWITEMRKYIRNIYYYLLILFIYVGCIEQAQAERWFYRNPLDQKTIITIETNPDSFGIQDVRDDAKFCRVKSKYVCIKSKGFKFAVPKMVSNSRKSWTKNNVTYDLIETREITLENEKGSSLFINS